MILQGHYSTCTCFIETTFRFTGQCFWRVDHLKGKQAERINTGDDLFCDRFRRWSHSSVAVQFTFGCALLSQLSYTNIMGLCCS